MRVHISSLRLRGMHRDLKRRCSCPRSHINSRRLAAAEGLPAFSLELHNDVGGIHPPGRTSCYKIYKAWSQLCGSCHLTHRLVEREHPAISGSTPWCNGDLSYLSGKACLKSQQCWCAHDMKLHSVNPLPMAAARPVKLLQFILQPRVYQLIPILAVIGSWLGSGNARRWKMNSKIIPSMHSDAFRM